MWTNETIFSAGDLAQRDYWVDFMHREYGYEGRLNDETAWRAVEDRKAHIKACIERLQDELEMIDIIAADLLREDEC